MSGITYSKSLSLPCLLMIVWIGSASLEVLQTVSYFNGAQEIVGIAADANGNFMITGEVQIGTNFTIKNSEYSMLGIEDAFLSIFDASGDLSFSSFFGGESFEYAKTLAVDHATGVVFIAGLTASANLTITPNAFQTSFRYGGYNGFLAAFSPSGSLLYSTYIGESRATVEDVQICNGRINIVGKIFEGTSLNTTIKTDLPDYQVHGFVIALDSSTYDVIFSRLYGGNSSTWVTQAACRNGYNFLYISGNTWSIDLPSATNEGQRNDAFVAKLDAIGNVVFTTYIGGESSEFLTSLAVEEPGHAWVAGDSTSWNYFPQIGTPIWQFQEENFTFPRPFLAKIDADTGAIDFCMTTNFAINSITIDPIGFLYVGGDARASYLPSVTHFAGESDCYVAKINPTSSCLVWGSYFGGSGVENHCKSFGINGTVYTAASTTSLDLPVTPNAFDPSSSNDKYSTCFAVLDARADSLDSHVSATYHNDSCYCFVSVENDCTCPTRHPFISLHFTCSHERWVLFQDISLPPFTTDIGNTSLVVEGNVDGSNGTLQIPPGGTVYIGGNFTETDNTTLTFPNVTAGGGGSINVTGCVIFGGVINISLASSYYPGDGDHIYLIHTTGCASGFDEVNLHVHNLPPSTTACKNLTATPTSSKTQSGVSFGVLFSLDDSPCAESSSLRIIVIATACGVVVIATALAVSLLLYKRHRHARLSAQLHERMSQTSSFRGQTEIELHTES